jgi:hypothetical protein
MIIIAEMASAALVFEESARGENQIAAPAPKQNKDWTRRS